MREVLKAWDFRARTGWKWGFEAGSETSGLWNHDLLEMRANPKREGDGEQRKVSGLHSSPQPHHKERRGKHNLLHPYLRGSPPPQRNSSGNDLQEFHTMPVTKLSGLVTMFRNVFLFWRSHSKPSPQRFKTVFASHSPSALQATKIFTLVLRGLALWDSSFEGAKPQANTRWTTCAPMGTEIQPHCNAALNAVLSAI